MKRKFTYFTVYEERGGGGLQPVRLVAGDNGNGDTAVGFDTLTAARDYVYSFVAECGRQATNRGVRFQESAPNEFKVTWEYQNEQGRWEICYRRFKIKECAFALFTADDVATRMIQGF